MRAPLSKTLYVLKLKTFKASKILWFSVIYLACWIFSYVLINGDVNIKYMVEYFISAWSFNGFIRPLYTWIFSLVIFFPVIGIIFFIERRKHVNVEKTYNNSLKRTHQKRRAP